MKAYLLWLAKFITVLFIFIFLIPVLLATSLSQISNSKQGALVAKNNQVAVIELTGPILDSKEIVQNLYRNVKDSAIDGIVLRIDSPGGAVAPSQEIFNAVKSLKSIKPIVVSMGTVAASGGLYSALGASKIFLQAGTQTGSIGVIVQIPNFHKLTDKFGVDFLTVKSGELKDVGNPTRALTEQDRTFLQSTVNKIYQQFIEDVASGRNLDIEAVKKFADGRLILGNEAIDLGLADQIGDIYSAARAIYEIKGQPLPEGEMPNLIYKDDKLAKLRMIFNSKLDLISNLLGLDQKYQQQAEFFLY